MIFLCSIGNPLLSRLLQISRRYVPCLSVGLMDKAVNVDMGRQAYSMLNISRAYQNVSTHSDGSSN